MHFWIHFLNLNLNSNQHFKFKTLNSFNFPVCGFIHSLNHFEFKTAAILPEKLSKKALAETNAFLTTI
jgi:hypothetical protein